MIFKTAFYQDVMLKNDHFLRKGAHGYKENIVRKTVLTKI